MAIDDDSRKNGTVLETRSGILLDVIGARVPLGSFTIEATARPSDITRSHDREYAASIARWEHTLAGDQRASRLMKPKFGAHIFLQEVSISPPAIDSKLEHVRVGGTGTEWTVRWQWHLPSHIDSGRFIVSSAVDSLQISV